MLHFLGEIEAVFGIWVLPLLWLVGWRAFRSRAARVAGIALAAQVALVLAAYAVAPDPAIKNACSTSVLP